MTNATIREEMEVISADGVHVGVVDGVDSHRIKLNRQDSGSGGLRHFIDRSHVADIEGDKVRLAFNFERVPQFWVTE